MIKLSNYITEKLHLNKGINKEIENYDFKILDHASGNNSLKIIENARKLYNKDVTAEMIQDIETDKLLFDKGFSMNYRDRKKILIKKELYTDGYFICTPVNKNGYCIIFFNEGYTVPWYFLITKAASKVGKTLNAIEWVESKEYEKEIHKYDTFELNKTFYDDINDAWDYIEKTYGKF